MGRGRGRPFYLPVWYEGTPAERFASPENTYVRCEGMTIALADGTTLEDWTGQVFVNNIGMGRPEVAKALADQAARMSWLSPAEFAEVRLALTEDLRAVMPRHLTTPFYGIGGSGSIEAAIRAAWAVHTPDPYDAFQASGEWEHAGERTLEGIRTTMRRHGPRSFACVVVEPVMGVAGAVPLSPDLPKGLRELCDRYAIKLVADEVITGFGRTGAWFGSTTVGLKPDAIVVAKGLTGGYAPLGAAVFERSWGATLRKTGFPHGLTFGAHPLGCTAARETIRILRRERLVECCKAVGGYLQRRFEALWQEHPAVVRDVRGHGLLLAMELRAPSRRPVRGGLHPAWRRVARIWKRLRDEGIRVTTNTDGSSLLLCPPFIVTERQVDRLVERLAVHLRAA